MTSEAVLPLVGVTACLKSRDEFHFHSVGTKYVDAVVVGTGALPVLIPALADRLDPDALLDRLDGVMVTGSPSNVDPAHYGGPAAREDNLADPARDATTLPLIRRAVARGVPLLAICRGIQELNVAFGGTLHTRVHEQPAAFDHRAPQGEMEERYGPRHPVELAADSEIARLVGSRRIEVNSLHWQAIDRLGERLAVEGRAPDGVIEAVRVADARSFALGVQWHPEWKVLQNPVSVALFRAFGDAARRRAEQRAARGLAA
jgi:putative glutamine amidotransferase